jgi:carboxyl-terminal processing protease
MISAIYSLESAGPLTIGVDRGRRQDQTLMSIATRIISPLRRMPALLAFLAVAGCASGGTSLAANADYERDRRMFIAGYEDIDQYYIIKEDLGNLTVGGLSALASIDQKISVKRADDKVDLDYGGATAASFVVTSGFDADDWAVLTAGALVSARKVSPAIAKASSEAVYQAIFNGMLARLDQFSRYAGHDAAAENRATREGFGGIGVRIAVEDGKVRVVSVMHYTPAERAGLHTDDIITAIDGTPTKGLDQQAVVTMLRGADDSRVMLTVQRGTVDKPMSFAVTRAHVVPETVTYRREGDIAYIKMYGFNQGTADSLRRELDNARGDMGENMRGIVLDLRGNPGGLLDQAVAVSDMFLNSGRIVSTHGRNPDSHQYFEATPGDVIDGLPIAVLINGNSASASEIVAAALQDNDRAVVIGSNSYGKGTVQELRRLPNDGELTLTWARFHAPSGYTLHHVGVLPSICTNKDDEDATQLLADLGSGKLPPLPVAQRNATSPDDTPGLDKIRAACPVYHAERAVDLEVAIRLLTQPRLYARAVALADPGKTSATLPSADLTPP